MNNKNLNFDLKSAGKVLRKDLIKAQKYVAISFIVVVFGLYAFLVIQIGQLSQKEPSDDQVLQQLGKVKRLKIDEDSINKITQLKDQNVQVQSLFDEARDNPFIE